MKKALQGMRVMAGEELLQISNLSRVWVIAQVPEQQVEHVQSGQTVSMEIPALGNEQRRGQLIYVGETVNPETRTVIVRTAIDNADGRLKPAMLATMLITGKPVDRVVVPGSATVREGDSDHVFVATGDAQFRLTPVRLGPENDGRRPVLSGLGGGETIVIEGAFHLNNERKRKELEGG